MLTLLSFGPEGWMDDIFSGVLVTVSLALATLPFGLAMGFFVALAKQSEEPMLRLAGNIYTTIFRGIPELLTLFVVYYGAQIGLQQLIRFFRPDAPFFEINSFVAGMIALGVVFSSYSSETFLSAFRAIPRSQYEGGYAVGLTNFQTMRLVVLPQLIRIALPGLANLWNILLKETALVSAIGLPDILRQSGIAARVSKEPFLFFGVACLIYLVLSMLSGVGINWIDRLGRPQGTGPMSAVTEHVVDIPPPPARLWTRDRILGAALLAVWALVGIGLVTYFVLAWNPELFNKYLPYYISGLGVTLTLVVIATVLGAILSIPVAYARMSNNIVLSSLAYAYVYFFRGTPLLAQTFLVYYGFGSFRPELESVGLWIFFREAWYCAIFAFTLNTAAYQAEILRGAIDSVPKGQWEGAASLGLHNFQTLRSVVLPQALIVALRPYGNEIILMIKGSAIVAIITVYDLMGETQRAFSRSFDFQTYLWAGVLYLTMVEALRHTVDWIERYLTKHLKR